MATLFVPEVKLPSEVVPTPILSDELAVKVVVVSLIIMSATAKGIRTKLKSANNTENNLVFVIIKILKILIEKYLH
jgi:hypothetical protein